MRPLKVFSYNNQEEGLLKFQNEILYDVYFGNNG